MTLPPLPSFDEFYKKAVCTELRARLRLAALSHFLLLGLVLIFTPVLRDLFVFTLFISMGLVVVNIVRLKLSRQVEPAISDQAKWFLKFRFYLCATAFLWGLLCLQTLHFYQLGSFPPLILLIVVSASAASANIALGSSASTARTYIGIMLGIPICGLIYWMTYESLVLAVFTSTCLVYHWLQTAINSRNFRISTQQDFDLKAIRLERDADSQLLREILDGLEDCVYLKDPKGTYQMVNKASKHFCNWPAI